MDDETKQKLDELGETIDNILEFESIFAKANDELTNIVKIYEDQIEYYKGLCESFEESIRVLEVENEALLNRLQWKRIEK